jgi:proline iminopeptidase
VVSALAATTLAGTPGPGPVATGRLVTRDGLGLSYQVTGGGPDTVIVPFGAALLPALGDLGRRRTMIFYDMRGRGRSDPIVDPSRVGFDRDVEDLEDVRAHFGVGRASLIGFSYLGGVVASYASRWPEHVDHLVLLGGVGPRTPGAPVPDLSLLDVVKLAKLQAAFPNADQHDPAEYCREYWNTYLPLFVGGVGRPTDGARQVLIGLCDLPNERPTSFLKVLAPIAAEAATKDLRAIGSAIKAPTLILHGDADHVAPLANARAWTEVIADVRLEVIQRAGHALWAEAAEEVLEQLDRFLPGRR